MLSACLAPEAPYALALQRDDPLYQAARAEHQRYLEELESYVNCLERQRGRAFAELEASYRLFLENFGKDAVYQYSENPKPIPQR